MTSKRRLQAQQTAAILETAGTQEQILSALERFQASLARLENKIDELGKVSSSTAKAAKTAKEKKAGEEEGRE